VLPYRRCDGRASPAKLTAAVSAQGWRVSSTTVGHLLHALAYRLQALRKTQDGRSHPARNAQCAHLNAAAPAFLDQQQPVISADTKKKELVGDFKNAAREWQPTGTPEPVRVHDFPSGAVGKAIPNDVYDMARNEAWVSVGRDHDTPAFAVASIRRHCRQFRICKLQILQGLAEFESHPLRHLELLCFQLLKMA
jgi:hypothetical protein